jgi:hypothetical protein
VTDGAGIVGARGGAPSSSSGDHAKYSSILSVILSVTDAPELLLRSANLCSSILFCSAMSLNASSNCSCDAI